SRASCSYCARLGWSISASSLEESSPRPTFPNCTRWAWRASSARVPPSTRSSSSCARTRGRGMHEALVESFRQKNRVALARLVSLAARGEQLPDPPAPSRPARVVAITGAGGVGKSSLTGKLIEQIRSTGQTVAVLACDPESPVSGGALLGDRFRMPARAEDDGTFIRSLAAGGGHGAMAPRRHAGTGR